MELLVRVRQKLRPLLGSLSVPLFGLLVFLFLLRRRGELVQLHRLQLVSPEWLLASFRAQLLVLFLN